MNQPPENWVIVYKSTSEYEIDVVKAMLADHSITAEYLNNHDHAIGALTYSKEIALYVHKTELDKATQIIKNAEIE